MRHLEARDSAAGYVRRVAEHARQLPAEVLQWLKPGAFHHLPAHVVSCLVSHALEYRTRASVDWHMLSM